MSSECEDQMLNMKSRSLNAEHSLPYEQALLMCLRKTLTPPDLRVPQRGDLIILTANHRSHSLQK